MTPYDGREIIGVQLVNAIPDRRDARMANAVPFVPKYVRIARTLCDQIDNGTILDFGTLPSATELAEMHGVSATTARRAKQLLVTYGYAYDVDGEPHAARKPKTQATGVEPA
jgi:DNA-binding GntR family transcriptional regulator